MDTEKSIQDPFGELSKETGDEISISRFERYGLGEAAEDGED